MSFDNLLIERDGTLVVTSIKRLRVLDALDSRPITQLREAVPEVACETAAMAAVDGGIALGHVGTTAFLRQRKTRSTSR